MSSYKIVLTHDVDHLALRNVPLLSRKTGSFIKQCVFSNLKKFLKNEINGFTYIKSLLAVLSLPPVKAGWFEDPMARCLRRILEMEKQYGVRSTFYFIPFMRTPGLECQGVPASQYRGADYDVRDYGDLLLGLEQNGWEVGIHGINAHIGANEAAEELQVFQALLPGKKKWGMRVHWLYQPGDLWKNLKKAGYYYDTTFGSNEETGFKDQCFHPFKKDGLWVLPLNIQDGALLAGWHKNLSPARAWEEIRALMDTAKEKQAVLTILWHNASFGPPRYWDGVYRKIIEKGLDDGAEFLTALQAVEKFSARKRQ
jgi:peptidoglycan/xylan/chitin deacetylase (PgdA/CDA1 family)